MLFFRRNLFICYLLVVALLTSVFAVGLANNFTYANIGSASLFKMDAPVLACKYYNKLEIRQKCRQAWHDVIKTINVNSKTPQQCERLINVVTLFPATAVAKLHKIQAFSRSLMIDEPMGNPHSFSEILYRPPIG